jgi:transcriptional regulator with XRE-family HTH domain
MSDMNSDFAHWMRQTRTKAGLSQQKIADALRAQGHAVFVQTTIAKIERGERPIRLDEAVAIAALFGSTVDAALGLKPHAPQIIDGQSLARRTSLLQQVQALIDAELTGGAR